MHLVIPFSHKDLNQARRLLLWLKHTGFSGFPVTLAVSQFAAKSSAGKQVISLGREFFGAELFVPHDENERGWPWSATHLFQRTLAHMKDDFFWLEPDCVPMYDGWFDDLVAEYEASGEVFMGRLVEMPEGLVPNHMTGCAFYGKRWREVYPTMADPIKGCGAWDVDMAPVILKHFESTNQIHHEWKRPDAKHVASVADVEPGVALFHQCKTGTIMSELDPEFNEWALTELKARHFIYDNMTRYFLTKNASKTVFAGGKTFHFEPVTYFAPTSSFWGVYQTDDESEGLALESVAQAGHISQLNEVDYAEFLEKKKKTPASPVSLNSNVPKRQLGPDVIQTANVLLVEGGKFEPPVEVATAVAAETVDEALAVRVMPAEKESLPRKVSKAKTPARK